MNINEPLEKEVVYRTYPGEKTITDAVNKCLSMGYPLEQIASWLDTKKFQLQLLAEEGYINADKGGWENE